MDASPEAAAGAPISRPAPDVPGAAAANQAPRARVDSVDLLRGLVMVIMMLDHTRDFVHADAFVFDPTDIAKTYPLLFFTRWITHFCAPVFVFLSGTGAYLQALRGKTTGELSRFLLSRGAWLVVLELTVVRLLIFFNFHYVVMLAFLQVIWVIGWGMIVLAGAVHLRVRTVATLSIAMIALHDLLDGVRVTSWNGPGTPAPGLGASLWSLMHQPGLLFPFGYPGPAVQVLYPLVPWIGVMGAGYAFGAIYRLDADERRRITLRLGLVIVAAFVVIRALNRYGDPSRWAMQRASTMTLLSFLNTSKYPPSLLYLLMTLGPALLFLAVAEHRDRGRGWAGRALIVFGRVPLLFYLLQWFTTHGLAVIANAAAGKGTAYLFGDLGLAPPPPPGFGFGLGMVYVLWMVGVLLLYPVCRWYAGVKARRRDWWLSYL